MRYICIIAGMWNQEISSIKTSIVFVYPGTLL